MDTYNIAIRYLIKKYGVKTDLKPRIKLELRRCRTISEKRMIENNLTDNDYNYVVHKNDVPIKKHNDYELILLCEQYNHSCFQVQIRREIENKLIMMKIIK